MSIEELMQVKLTVASKKPTIARLSPGIVTLVTDEDIAALGARDLMDVLLAVPGFSPAVDVEGAVNFGVRGIWVHEGKMLLIVDGQEMDEILYSSLQFGNHFPAELIKKIEIIRGPGSAVYGGYAELAVINITTKGAESLKGAEAHATYGQLKNGLGRRTLSAAYGGRQGELGVAVLASAGQGQRSDRGFTDGAGTALALEGNSKLDPVFFNLGLDFRFLFDRYGTTSIDQYGSAGSDPGRLHVLPARPEVRGARLGRADDHARASLQPVPPLGVDGPGRHDRQRAFL